MIKNIGLVILFGLIIIFPAQELYANWYVGLNKSGTFRGIRANIKTPPLLPMINGMGESAWVTNVTSSGGWIQTGIRYHPGYANFKTYVEVLTASGGLYSMNETGTQALNSTMLYEVSWVFDSPPTGRWKAYIGGSAQPYYLYANADQTNVQAQSESHNNTNIMGPFQFSGVQHKNTSNAWVTNTNAPKAQAPYKITITTNADWKAHGP